jgi:hypothetical protein
MPMEAKYRPALFARYKDLTSLRYDFPIVLNRGKAADQTLISLSRLVDNALAALSENPDADRIARQGYRLELEVRRELKTRESSDLADVWQIAADRLAVSEKDENFRDSANQLMSVFDASGDIVDVDSDLPLRAVQHAWHSIQNNKTDAFRNKAERLLLRLRDILAAEKVNSKSGRASASLKSAVGASFEDAFDFDAMSKILEEAKPGSMLSDARRTRIHKLIDVLENQRFYALGNGGPEPYIFAFDRCSEAQKAYQERHSEAVELAKTLAVAELEVNGDYRDATHDVVFEGFGDNGLDADQLAGLPHYLVCTNANSLDPAETANMVELLAAGMPIKVLVQTDDVLERSPVAEGHVALGLRARQLVATAIGLTDVFVFQSTASHLFRKHGGDNGHTGEVPPYLVAAAAMESRVFPTLVYDPSAGSDWATRLSVEDNPKPDDDWPVSPFAFEDKDLQAQSVELAFTLADFMAMDKRFFGHYAVVPKADWSNALMPVPEALATSLKSIPDKVPCVTLVDDKDEIQKAILDNRTLLEVERSLTMWHSLQELGGIHNSHAERLLAQERKRLADISQTEDSDEVPVGEPASPETVDDPMMEPVEEEVQSDEPYIETARCTTCNECTEINGKLFAYNENKQAYIADATAGTFRQLVEAAEGCQVSIIHPGKPQNPKEPGLDDLIKRAAEFV